MREPFAELVGLLVPDVLNGVPDVVVQREEHRLSTQERHQELEIAATEDVGGVTLGSGEARKLGRERIGKAK